MFMSITILNRPPASAEGQVIFTGMVKVIMNVDSKLVPQQKLLIIDSWGFGR